MIEKKAYRIHLGRLSHYPDLEVVFGEIMAENAIERVFVGYEPATMKSWVEITPKEKGIGTYNSLEYPDVVFAMHMKNAQLVKYLDYDTRLRNLLLDKPEINSIEVTIHPILTEDDVVYSVFTVEEVDTDELSMFLKTLKGYTDERGMVQLELNEGNLVLKIQGSEREMEVGIGIKENTNEVEGPYFEITQTPPFGSLTIDNPISHETDWPIGMKNSGKMKAYIEENKEFLVNLIKETKARCYYLCL